MTKACFLCEIKQCPESEVSFHATPPYATIINLKNISKIPCQATVDLEEDSEFRVYPEEFEISLDNKVELFITLSGRKKGHVESVLYIALKNNPMVFRLKLAARVAHLDFNITPKYLNFDQTPLDYSVKQHIKLINSTLVDLKWKFIKYDWATKIYKINKLRGDIKINSTDRIEVEFKPTKEEIYPQKNIDIQIFDPLCSEDVPFLVDTISLQSEAVEYLVKITDHIDLGEIKGKVEYQFPLKLFNVGKTNIHLILEKLVDPPGTQYQKIRRIFRFNFASEILQPQKQSEIIVHFNPTEEIEFHEVPIFVCKFLDPNKPQNVVKSFTIKYSAVVLLSKFSICPASGVHFGALELQNSRSQTITLKNIGKCNFSFNISNFVPGAGEPQIKTVEKGKIPRFKVNLPSTPLDIPGFSITPAGGTLEAGASTELTVTFIPKALGVYKDNVVLSVSEPIRQHMFGKKIALYGEAAEPRLDFHNYSKMFKEHYIVNNADELIISSDIGTYTYFVVSKKVLCFEYACIRKEYQAKIYLQNLGQLIAVVVTKVYGCNNFTVSPTQFTIDPYNTATITITFKPDSINFFEGRLELSSNATTNNSFDLLLHGRSYVPQIELSGLPPPEENSNFYKLFFKPTYINKIKVRKIGVKNIGVIACQFIVDITDSGSSMFYVTQNETLPNKHDLTDSNLVATSLKISLKPSEKTYIYLVFKPKKEDMFETFVNVYIVDNPFETNKIQVFGHCYSGDIYIDTLETLNPHGMFSKTNEVAYLLDFGDTPVAILQKQLFTITNNSLTDTYRFELKNDIGTLNFMPRIGHLAPNTSKQILAINMSDVPFSLIQESVILEYVPITTLEEQRVAIPWDERQQFLTWLEYEGKNQDHLIQQHFRDCVDKATDAFLKSEVEEKAEVAAKLKVSLEREEPEVIYNSDEWQTISILVNFTTDYATCTSSLEEIRFPDTFIKDKSESTFKIINCGKVPFDTEWKIVYDNITPKFPEVEIINKSEEENVTEEEDSSNDGCFNSTRNHNFDTTAQCVHPKLLEIIPKKRTIPVNNYSEFKVIFSPLAACTYTARLVPEIESFNPDLKPIEIAITATSVVPDYYFELEDSDYMKRRTVTKCLKYFDGYSKILEIISVGIGITTIKRFSVLNTSFLPLNFKMDPVETEKFSYIQCKTPSGIIQVGKKFEMVFSFTSQDLGTFEEEYIFSTSNKKEVTGSLPNKEEEYKETETKLLIVGISRNPKVYFKVAHINLPATLLKIPTHETVVLRNEEEEELGFKILKESFFSYDHLQKLKVIPNSGTIMPKSEITMQIIYNAETVGDSTFSLLCLVDRITTPLTLNVSAKCLEIECKIQYTNYSGEEITLDPNSENIIDLGKIGIKSKTCLNFIFTNLGKTGFFYTWHYNKSHIEHLINISPKRDKEFIQSGSTVKRELTFETHKKYILTNFPMKIEISYGPIYNMKFHVSAEFPLCKFSFSNYNFGNCVIQPYFTKNYTVLLDVKNLEPHPVKLDNLFEDTENITVDFKSKFIHSKCSETIPIYFHPRKEGQYEFLVPIVVNCTKRIFKVTGAGVKINLQLMQQSDKFIDMGEIKLGDCKRHEFYVINRTPTQVNTILFFSQDIPVIESKEEDKLKPDFVVLSHSPRTSLNFKPKKDASGIAKTPKNLIETKNKGTDANAVKEEEPFKSKKDPSGIVAKTPKNLIETKNKGTDTNAVKEEEPFKSKKDTSGTIAKTPKNLIEVKNKGADAHIMEEEPSTSELLKKPNFCIEPKEPVQMDFNKKYKFMIEFRPNERLETFNQKIYYKIQDFIAPLCSVKAKCLVPEFSLDKEILTFPNVLIGTPRVKYVLLKNTGDIPIKFKWICDNFQHLKIHPAEGYVKAKSDVKIDFSLKIKTVECQWVRKCKCLINNKYSLDLALVANSISLPPPISKVLFSCPVRQTVTEYVKIINKTKTLWCLRPIVSNKNFIVASEIVVDPESSSDVPVLYHPKQMTDEEAILILPLPDEEILYQFIGEPLPPLPEKRITVEIRSKQNYCHVLPVFNWSDIKLCFEVKTVLKSAPTPKTLYKTFGLELIDLLPGEEKEYKWNIYVLNEEHLSFQVNFTDKQTKEYLFYEILVKVHPPEPIEFIRMTTCVREPVKTKIKLKNPINIPIDFRITSPHPELQFKNFVSMLPYTAYDLEVTYFPIKAGEFITNIDARSPELGVFSYTLCLSADKPSAEKPLRFIAELGSKALAAADFKNTFSVSLDISAKFDDPEFAVEKLSKFVLPGETATLTISFEPSAIGILESKLVINSPVSGSYMFPLYGECIPPTPKGPFTVKPGGTTNIPFFNPFNDNRMFQYSCDSKIFSPKISSEEIKARKTSKIPVSCSLNAREKLDENISCPQTGRLVVNSEKMTWIFYLQTD